MSQAEFDRLQMLADAAVLDPPRWRDVCDALAQYLGGVGTILVPEAIDRQTPRMVASEALEGLMAAAFRGDWQHRNYRRLALPLIKSRGYATDLDIADAATMAREPFYAEFLAGQKLGVYVGLSLPTPGQNFTASVQRRLTAPTPDHELFEGIERARPVLLSAVRASVALGGMRLQTWQDLAADPSRGAFLIDDRRLVIDRSAAAEALIGEHLSVSRKQLRLTNQRANEQLQQLIALATSGMVEVLPRPVFVDLPPAGSIMLEALPLPRSLRYFHATAAALLVARPVGDIRVGLPALLRQRLNLTDTEVRVALGLFEGRSPQQIAEAHAAAVGTVRQQIKAILRKSGTVRQTQLMAVMRRLADGDSA